MKQEKREEGKKEWKGGKEGTSDGRGKDGIDKKGKINKGRKEGRNDRRKKGRKEEKRAPQKGQGKKKG